VWPWARMRGACSGWCLCKEGSSSGPGTLLGIAGALGLTRLLRTLLYEVTPTDPLTFIATTFLLVGVAIVACLNPARQVLNVDPMTVLRHE
jgi:hypothetical protein